MSENMAPPGYRQDFFAAAGIYVSESARLYGDVGNQILGVGARIDDNVVISGAISIGPYCHIGAGATLHGGSAGIILEEGAAVSCGTHVYAHSDDYVGAGLPGPCVPDEFKTTIEASVFLGEWCVVGANSVILPGAWIGAHAAIGALSLVRAKDDVRPYTVHAGSPLKWIGKRDAACLDAALLSFRGCA